MQACVCRAPSLPCWVWKERRVSIGLKSATEQQKGLCVVCVLLVPQGPKNQQQNKYPKHPRLRLA